jgi:3-oxoacyl-[acyl-carrier protein] reductase
MKAADLFNLKGRVALVTGASSGLGVQFSRALADNGAAVALVARRADRLKALKDEIEGKGGKAAAIEADVTDRAAMSAAFDAAEKAFGTVTVLVNNAGIAQKPMRAVDVPSEEWRKVMSVDLDAVFHNAQEAARRMLAAKAQGCIINIASVLGLGVTGNLASYSASKAGLIHLTRALAREWAGKGIRVNAIAPGYIATDINQEFFATPAGERLIRRIPQRRLGSESDLDGALLLLASRASRYMTGSVLVVDGGYLLA